MQNLNFRLTMESLDDRCLPSVTPDMVYSALVHQEVVWAELEGVIEKLNEPKTEMTLGFLPTHLRERAISSQSDVAILADYLHALQSNPNSDPHLVGMIAMAEYTASVNAGYAEFYALAYGAPHRLPFSLSDPSWVTVSGSNGVRIWDVSVDAGVDFGTGTGTGLALGNTFTATYTGYLTDGTIFDSNTLNNTVLSTSSLIKGFVAGLQGMKVGGTRRIDIPASEAYGANPPSSSIPPNSELVFEVKLTAVTP